MSEDTLKQIKALIDSVYEVDESGVSETPDDLVALEQEAREGGDGMPDVDNDAGDDDAEFAAWTNTV